MSPIRVRVGRSTRKLIENTPAFLAVEFFAKVLSDVETEESEFVCELDSNGEPQARLSEKHLDGLSPELLGELESHSERVMEFSEEMGAQSLKTIVAETASSQEKEVFEEQLDDWCRSCWTFLELQSVFQNAESFHHARKDRSRGNICSAFALDLTEDIPASADSIDISSLATRLGRVLALPAQPQLCAIDLAATKEHPESVMLIIRHGGTLSSVYAHRDDGTRHPLYYRPQDEIVLIYTAADRKIEVLGNSFGQRHDVSNTFAELVLNQNISAQPLSEKVFDLGRFAETFELENPNIEGVDIQSAAVTEFELLLGSYARRVTLKVARCEDIDSLARKYLAGALRFRGSAGIHRVAISVEYRLDGARRSRKLNITVRGTNGSNIQSHKSREARELGSRLLKSWNILRQSRPLGASEAAEMLPALLRLFDLRESVVTGLQLSELGLHVDDLLDARLIVQKARQKAALVEDENESVVEVDMSDLETSPGHSVVAYTEFKVALEWLGETVAKRLAAFLDDQDYRELGVGLYGLGSVQISGSSVQVYLSYGLADIKAIDDVGRELERRTPAGPGILLCSGAEAPRFVANNVVIPITEVWVASDQNSRLDLEAVKRRLSSDRNLIVSIKQAKVVLGGLHTGNFMMPGKPSLPLSGRIQLAFFEKLAEAYNSGVPDVYSGDLIEGTSSRSPREIFTGKMRERVFADYVEKGSSRSFWRLKE